MITPSHLIYSWAFAKKTERPHTATRKRALAFVLGALFPDTPTYLYTQYSGRWRVLISGIGILYIIRLLAEPLYVIFMHYGT